MSRTFFSHRRTRAGGATDSASPTLERQQALVMRALREAAGAPVSYGALRDAGVEFPASVVSELELAGVHVERCYEHANGSRMAIGVRLGAAHDATAEHDMLAEQRSIAEHDLTAAHDPSGAQLAAAALARDVGGERVRMSAGVRWPSAWPRMLTSGAYLRWLASWALVAAVALLAVLAIVGLSAGAGRAGGAGAGRAVARVRRRASGAGASSSARPRAATRRASAASPGVPAASRAAAAPRAPAPARTPVGGALAAQLEAQGHELVQAGQYGDAVPVLRKALAATGESVAGCVQPTSETCLTFAYALYDLGRALRLEGSTAAAVGVLEHRLQIENQRPVVAEELASARRELG